MYSKWGKRSFDIALITLFLIILVPVILLLYLLIRIKLGYPVFFTQMRPGKDGKLFRMVKFRTMTDDRDINGALLPDAERLPAFGQFLRSTSLDELPELWSVIKGEMSLVGPRPLLMQYLDRYTDEQMQRHEVKPGITGWAQINGRNAISWEAKFSLDVWYVRNYSLWLDIKILGLTLLKVLRREDIAQDGQATMSEFMGSSRSNTQR
jgi:sugar transferase EpsL